MENHVGLLFNIGGLNGMMRDFCSKGLHSHRTFERNATLHRDFWTGDLFAFSRYVLDLKDEATHFVDLVACDKGFGAHLLWASDSRSHLKGKVIAKLSRRPKERQEFIVSYFPWKNGSGKPRYFKSFEGCGSRISRELTQLNLLVAAGDVKHQALTGIFSNQPSVYRTVAVPKHCEYGVFSGGKGRVVTLNNPRPNKENQPTALQLNIMAMHKTNVVAPDITTSVGDYVLRLRVDEKLHANQLRIMCVDPCRVTTNTDYYFRMEHLVNGSTTDVHPSR
ncbi:LOW QUALITY PROTEIN: hypothetical protein PHMEG_00030624 [Phytophthora megakarya]|uniref:Uncharacterized protein n=1 Tax=Phytophthora megakarya TaxID=4795 RepID=A0A225V2I7_9STRA|nr:LOW QUALITY PROTEIN: hypothetical protein PHMEG_00030624 [Phytophthora megakarya]